MEAIPSNMSATEENPESAQIRRRKRNVLEWVFVVLLGVAACGWAAINVVGSVFPSWIQSDTVWMVSLARDLFHNGGRLSTWSLSPHPNIFPELPVVIAGLWLSSDLQGFFLAHALLVSFTFLLVTWFCLYRYSRAGRCRDSPTSRSLGSDLGSAWLAAAAVTGAWLLLLNHGVLANAVRYALLPAFHFGAYWISLLIAFLIIDGFDRRISRAYITTLLVALLLLIVTTMSDRILLLFLLPGLVAAWAYAACMSRRIAFTSLTSVGAVITVGAITLWADDPFWSSLAHVNDLPLALGQDSLGSQLLCLLWAALDSSPTAMAQQGPTWIAGTALLVIGSGCVWVTGTLVVRLARAQQIPATTGCAKRSAMQVYLIVSAIAAPLAVAALGRCANTTSLRFVIPTCFSPLLALATVVVDRMSLPSRHRIVAALSIALATVAFPLRPSSAPWRDFGDPPIVQCLRRHAIHHPLRRGLGHHWHSHFTSVASNDTFAVRTIVADGQIPRWHNNAQWYGPEASPHPFSFILTSAQERLDHAGLLRRFGTPDRVLGCAGAIRSYDATRDRWNVPAREPILIWLYEDEKARAMTQEMARQQRLLFRRIENDRNQR